MPDPALLAIVQHFANPPAAIVQPATMTDAEPFLSAYEAIVADQDQAFEKWLAGEEEVRRKTREAVSMDPHAFEPEMFDDIIGPLEKHIRREKRVTARLEREGSGRMSTRMKALRERALARQRRQYEAADDLLTFLRNIRDEVSQAHRDVPTTAWTPNETTVAAMQRARAGHLEVVTLDDLRASILADD